MITKFTLLSVGLLFSLSVMGDVKLGAYEIPTLLEKNGSGTYDKIFSEVRQAAGKNWRYKVLPPSRADKDFADKRLDCIIPLDADFYQGDKVIQSDFVNVARVYIFTERGSKPVNSLAALKGKKIGARRGMPYGPEFDKLALNVSYSNNIEQSIKKVNAGRLDAFIAYVPDAWFAFQALNMEMLPHGKAVITHEDGFLCHDTPEAKAFIESFNAALVKLRSSGRLMDLLGDSWVEP